MHDGSIATLDEVHRPATPGRWAPRIQLEDAGLKPFTLTLDERRDLIAFLWSLTDREALRDDRWSNP